MSSNKKPTPNKTEKTLLQTNTGHKLTLKESAFIDNYIESGNARQSGLEAGYSPNAIDQNINKVLHKTYIQEEIKFRMAERQKASIATGQQVMEFFTKVMNGEVRDQFGLDAPLGERLKAANELAKRTIDIDNKLKGNNPDNKITLVIERRKDAKE